MTTPPPDPALRQGPPPSIQPGPTPPGRSDAQEPAEEKPWGPIRLRWRGQYLSPELASVVFLLALAVAFAAGAALWHTLRKGPVDTTAEDASGATHVADLSMPTAPLPARRHDGAIRGGGGSKPSAAGPVLAPDTAAAAPSGTRIAASQPRTSSTTGSSSPSVEVTAPPPAPASDAKPVIRIFSASVETINPGGSVTLSWVVSGEADKVIISPEPGLVKASGSFSIRPDHSMPYIITATGPGGSSTDQLLVHVNATAAPTVDFSVDNAQVKLGQTATLHWTVNGADQVSIDPGIGPVNTSGSYRVKPLGTVRYNLVAQGPGGASGRTVVIQVAGNAGPSSGDLRWSGMVNGNQLVTIDRDHADIGSLTGSLPGVPCILQPADERRVSIASAPGPGNNFDRLVLRITGHGMTNVSIHWALQ